MARPPEAYVQQWWQILDEHELDWSEEEELDCAVQLFSEETGLPVVGIGFSRVVFGLDDERVLKIAFDTMQKSNLHECDVWQQAPEDLRSWLAPVLECDSDGSWLTMKRAEPLHGRPIPLLSDIRKLEKQLGVGDLGLTTQWGYLDGHPVIVDYGAETEHDVDYKKLKIRLLR